MKKLTLILSTVLLISSSAAMARSKTSKEVATNLGSKSNCSKMVGHLRNIASSEKDLRVEATCRGSVLIAKWKLNYHVSPTQKFKINFGIESETTSFFTPTLWKRAECNKVAGLLARMSGMEVSYDAVCKQSNQRHNATAHSYSIEGAVNLK